MKKELFISEDLRTLQNKSTESLVIRTGSNPNIINTGKPTHITKTSEKITSEKSSEKIVSEKSAEKIVAETTSTTPTGEQFRALLGIETNYDSVSDNDERLF